MKKFYLVEKLVITNIETNVPYVLTTTDGKPLEVEGELSAGNVEVVLSVDTEDFTATDPDGKEVLLTGNVTHLVVFDESLIKLYSTRVVKRDDIYSLDNVELSEKPNESNSQTNTV